MGSFVVRLLTQWRREAAAVADTRATDSVAHDTAGRWQVCGPCRARIVNEDDGGWPAMLVRWPSGMAAGLVRLDNRAYVRRLVACDDDGQSDLDLMVAALRRRGPDCIREFEGDFAFAYWDDTRQRLIVARDALGIRVLYQSHTATCSSFASHASVLGADRPYSLEYVADYIANNVSRTRTPYEGVTRVPPATYQVIQGEQRLERRYWSPFDFTTDWTVDHRTAIARFKELFEGAVRLHLMDSTGCWSQLSGGLDSSSVVSMAGWLAQADAQLPKLNGTLTYVDTLSIGDERPFSDTVVRDWPGRNVQLVDYLLWQDGEEDPPRSDEPNPNYPMFARDQFACQTIRSSGGWTLLTGVGPDHYLHGNWVFFADWIVRGRVADAVREMYRAAVYNKTSFWRLAYDNAIHPLLERRTRRRKPKVTEPWPAWVHPSFARRFDIGSRDGFRDPSRGPVGKYFATQAANAMAFIEHAVPRGVVADTLDVRHPFLHRKLVEFCLQLPPEMKVTNNFHKWILREAMRGILPEEVRRRRTKGFINTGIERSFVAQDRRLDSLLQHSILGDMGCIDVPLAREALSRRTERSLTESQQLRHLLTLETWLAVRSGRWTASESRHVAMR
jgi:asparagine synthase (glutamine-hydrolysing)